MTIEKLLCEDLRRQIAKDSRARSHVAKAFGVTIETVKKCRSEFPKPPWRPEAVPGGTVLTLQEYIELKRLERQHLRQQQSLGQENDEVSSI